MVSGVDAVGDDRTECRWCSVAGDKGVKVVVLMAVYCVRHGSCGSPELARAAHVFLDTDEERTTFHGPSRSFSALSFSYQMRWRPPILSYGVLCEGHRGVLFFRLSTSPACVAASKRTIKRPPKQTDKKINQGVRDSRRAAQVLSGDHAHHDSGVANVRGGGDRHVAGDFDDLTLFR